MRAMMKGAIEGRSLFGLTNPLKVVYDKAVGNQATSLGIPFLAS